jgi:bifunctional oligoribonuclease and PAP phosphatase NrnA
VADHGLFAGGDLIAIPEHRVEPLRAAGERLRGAGHVVLTTHLNADGDGAGSQAAVAAWLAGHGVRTTIVNPTPFPDQFEFLLAPGTEVADWGTPEAHAAVEAADLLLVLDTSEPARIGPLAGTFPRQRTIVIDHHPPGTEPLSDDGLVEPPAAATGELVYDLLQVNDGTIPDGALLGIYVAIVTDTGSFRFSNTNPRTHAIAGDLLRRGIDPEAVYQRLFATVPLHRLELLREALGTLRTDPRGGVSWLVVPRESIARHGATPSDLEGLVEYARSVEGTRVALLFRETETGETKVSFRSSGETDVNRIARRFGGGGHVKAAGAVVDGPPEAVIPVVLEAVRDGMKSEE